jgi:hypothetical protein
MYSREPRSLSSNHYARQLVRPLSLTCMDVRYWMFGIQFVNEKECKSGDEAF